MAINSKAEALELFIYCEETGSLKWRKTGKNAGYISKNDGYVTVMYMGKNYKAHRIAWLIKHGYWPNQVDHIDHVRHNNKISNLRNVCQTENSRNMSLRNSNTSGHVGVCWHKAAKKWMAYIHISGKFKSLGLFLQIEDAINARISASKNYGFHKNHGI